MELYGGIDLHSNNCVINLIDENDKVIIKKRIKNNLCINRVRQQRYEFYS